MPASASHRQVAADLLRQKTLATLLTRSLPTASRSSSSRARALALVVYDAPHRRERCDADLLIRRPHLRRPSACSSGSGTPTARAGCRSRRCPAALHAADEHGGCHRSCTGASLIRSHSATSSSSTPRGRGGCRFRRWVNAPDPVGGRRAAPSRASIAWRITATAWSCAGFAWTSTCSSGDSTATAARISPPQRSGRKLGPSGVRAWRRTHTTCATPVDRLDRRPAIEWRSGRTVGRVRRREPGAGREILPLGFAPGPLANAGGAAAEPLFPRASIHPQAPSRLARPLLPLATLIASLTARRRG